jgi:hypothetical protein
MCAAPLLLLRSDQSIALAGEWLVFTSGQTRERS